MSDPEKYLVEPLAVGWHCRGCGVFNGDAKEFSLVCRACGGGRPRVPSMGDRVRGLANSWRSGGWDAEYARAFLRQTLEQGTRLGAREKMAIACVLEEPEK